MWNESRLPSWLDEDMLQSGNHAADSAYPNEVCGFFVSQNQGVILHSFTGPATSWSCSASPSEVIRFAYWIEETSGKILASYHTHPLGETFPSDRDDMLSIWTKTHIIWIKQSSGWIPRAFQS